MKSGFLFHSLGSSPRWPSPRRRVSQRMTSAPNSQSTRATVGPAAPVVSSMTRMPSRGNLGIHSPNVQIVPGRWLYIMVLLTTKLTKDTKDLDITFLVNFVLFVSSFENLGSGDGTMVPPRPSFPHAFSGNPA